MVLNLNKVLKACNYGEFKGKYKENLSLIDNLIYVRQPADVYL